LLRGNNLAYFGREYTTKSFIALTRIVNVIKLFFFVTYALGKQAGVVIPGKHLRPSLKFAEGDESF
jgi:hypothetical protein